MIYHSSNKNSIGPNELSLKRKCFREERFLFSRNKKTSDDEEEQTEDDWIEYTKEEGLMKR